MVSVDYSPKDFPQLMPDEVNRTGTTTTASTFKVGDKVVCEFYSGQSAKKAYSLVETVVTKEGGEMVLVSTYGDSDLRDVHAYRHATEEEKAMYFN